MQHKIKDPQDKQIAEAYISLESLLSKAVDERTNLTLLLWSIHWPLGCERHKSTISLMHNKLSPPCQEAHIWSWSLQWSAEWLLMLCWVQKPSVMASGCSLWRTTCVVIFIMNCVMLQLNNQIELENNKFNLKTKIITKYLMHAKCLVTKHGYFIQDLLDLYIKLFIVC